MSIVNKKLFIIYSGRYPSEKAHSYFVSKNCESFAEEGVETVLMVSRRLTAIKEDPYNYFNVKKNFIIKRLPLIDLFPFSFIPQKIAFYFSQLVFSISCFFYFLFNAGKEDIIYSNEIVPLLGAFVLGKKIYYEMHDFPEQKLFFYKYFFNKINGVISTNKWKRDRLLREFKLLEKKILYAPNAIDLKNFGIKLSKSELRKILNLPLNKKIISYVGKYKTMGLKKGVDEIIGAFDRIYRENSNCFLLIVGLNIDEISEIKENIKKLNINKENYALVHHVPHGEIIKYLKSSDVLVMNYPNIRHYAYYMSPMKMFEYMAAGVPIVASNLPSIAEILNKQNSFLIKPDGLESLTGGIKEALNSGEAEGRAKNAFSNVKNYTWEIRAKKIINFIK
jgi:glycosyltransferase involved in cell wall biosynthesis